MKNHIPASDSRKKYMTIGLLILLLVALAVWLILTPPGIDGKLHAAGYSVCHQIESHSLSIGGKTLPLCARCTGTFMGLFFSLLYLSFKKKRTGIPSRLKIAILVLFCAAFLMDGINSSLTLLPGIKPFYQPDNRLRLITGLLFGISLANLILPLWHQTLWAEAESRPVLDRWMDLVVLILIAAAVGTLILLDISFLYYPIAILSTGTIFIVLGMIYSLLWCIILKKENTLHHLRDGIRILSAGVITAIFQVGMMDFARLMITKSW